MFRLIYTSVQKPGIKRHAFELLCEQAARNNRQVNVGGLLLCNGVEFMQCLEGPRDRVAMIYNTIVKDHRHKDIRLLESGVTRQRIFKNWSMMGLSIKPETVLSAEPIAYTLLDHRLYRPWKSLGESAGDLIYEYAKVKAELEKAGDTRSLSKVIEVYPPR